MTGLLTLPEASRELGLDPRGERLRRLLLAHEKATGRVVGVRLCGSSRTSWKVTLEALRAAFPDMFAEELTRLGRKVHAELSAIDQRIDERSEEVARRVIAPVRRELEERDEQVANMVLEVAGRVKRLAESLKTKEIDVIDAAAEKTPDTSIESRAVTRANVSRARV